MSKTYKALIVRKIGSGKNATTTIKVQRKSISNLKESEVENNSKLYKPLLCGILFQNNDLEATKNKKSYSSTLTRNKTTFYFPKEDKTFLKNGKQIILKKHQCKIEHNIEHINIEHGAWKSIKKKT